MCGAGDAVRGAAVAYEDAGIAPKLIRAYGEPLGLASDPVEYVIDRLDGTPYGKYTRDDVCHNAELLLDYSRRW